MCDCCLLSKIVFMWVVKQDNVSCSHKTVTEDITSSHAVVVVVVSGKRQAQIKGFFNTVAVLLPIFYPFFSFFQPPPLCIEISNSNLAHSFFMPNETNFLLVVS